MNTLVIITGSSSGIGFELVKTLSQDKNLYILAGVRQEHQKSKINQNLGDKGEAVFLDLKSSNHMYGLIEKVTSMKSSFSKIVLVNNAGFALGGPIELMTMNTIRDQFEVNFFGLLELTKLLLPFLREKKGAIINVSSISGRVSFPYLGAYCASKFALEAISDSLRCELSNFGVKVVLVEPGAVKTEIWEKSQKAYEEEFKSYPQDLLQNEYKNSKNILDEIVLDGMKRGIKAKKVAKLISKLVVKKSPAPRYLIGIDARVGSILNRLLPDALFDKIKTIM